MNKRLKEDRFDLQGHRGARGLAPENTLPAFARAMQCGVTTLELDTAISHDGIVVVAHDRRLNSDITRDTGGRWLKAPTPAIHSLSFAELTRFDVGRIDPGSPYFQRFPGQLVIDGTRMPRLADVFELVKRSGNRQVQFNIETKLSPHHPQDTPTPEAFAGALIQVIAEADVTARVIIQSFDWRTLRITRALEPRLRVSYLSSRQQPGATIVEGEDSAWTDGIDTSGLRSEPEMIAVATRSAPRESGAIIWSPHFADLSAGNLAEAHALGFSVIPWTLNDPEEITRAVAMGVDGLITDYPDRARIVLADMHIPLPDPVHLPA